ncbi:MAG: DUF4214 domain-containing protein [Pseudomonadota bacterium]
MSTSQKLGAFTAGLNVINYINEHYEEIEREIEWAQLRSDIDELGDLPNVVIAQNMAQSLGQAGTALNLLAQYRNSENASTRESLALEAVIQSEGALNAVMDQTRSAMDGAPIESLAYAFGALHYAITVRQEVAASVQDGPLGSAGLQETIREAIELMYVPGGGENDIYSNMPGAIADQVNIGARDFGFLGLNVTVQVTSPLSGLRQTVELDRDVIIEPPLYFPDPFFGTKIPIPNTGGPRPETDSEFFARISTAEARAKTSLINQERSNMDIGSYARVAQEMAEGLAPSSSVVDGLHELIGGSGMDIDTGTALADYISGLGGDDVLNGLGGSDALNGGSGDDILVGGDGADFLRGGAGDDKIYGDEEGGASFIDVARFEGLASDYTIEGGVDFAVVTGPGGDRDELYNIEFLRFDDGDIALPEVPGEVPSLPSPVDPVLPGPIAPVLPSPVDPILPGPDAPDFAIAARVTLLFEAALDRNGEIDLPGLNFYIDVTAEGDLTDAFLAADMMQSPEFTSKFGDVDSLTNGEFLGQIYQNVLDRPADEAGLDFYLDLMNDGVISRAAALADIATSPENAFGSADIVDNLVELLPGEWGFLA